MRTIIAWLVLTLTAFADVAEIILPSPPPIDQSKMVLQKGCVLYALDWQQALLAKKMAKPNWARLIRLKYEDMAEWHAYCVFEITGQIFFYSRQTGTVQIYPKTIKPSDLGAAIGKAEAELKITPQFSKPVQAALFMDR